MELQRGICSLCSENGKVFTSSAAAKFLKYLPRILYENFLPESKFQQIKDSLKVCSICCYKLELSSDIKKTMMVKTESDDSSDSLDTCCHFCESTKCVMKVKDDWKFFTQRTEGFLKLTDFPVHVCYRCMFYFDTIFHFKTKLSYKFPQLAVSTIPQKSSLKQNDTPKRKSLSSSPPNSKKRKIFDNCFTYLQPLCNDNYHVNTTVKTDAKMYRKIAYVNLKDVKELNKITPKIRPKIKIKLKQSSKKQERGKFQKKSTSEALEEINKIGQPYVKLCKSEEMPSNVHRNKQTRLSLPAKREEEGTEENLNETPKAASATNLAPKRRVSLYVELNDIDVDAEAEAEPEPEPEPEPEHEPEHEPEPETETEAQSEVEPEAQPEVEPEAEVEAAPLAEAEEVGSEVESEAENDKTLDVTPEEINQIVEKYIKDTSFNDSNKLELLQEIEESNVEENGIEKPTDEKEDINDTNLNNVDSQKLDGENNEKEPEVLQNEEKEGSSSEVTDSQPSTQDSIMKTPQKNDNGSEESDSDVSNKCKDTSNVDKDSLTMSDRKKKRVTFSDEVST